MKPPRALSRHLAGSAGAGGVKANRGQVERVPPSAPSPTLWPRTQHPSPGRGLHPWSPPAARCMGSCSLPPPTHSAGKELDGLIVGRERGAWDGMDGRTVPPATLPALGAGMASTAARARIRGGENRGGVPPVPRPTAPREHPAPHHPTTLSLAACTPVFARPRAAEDRRPEGCSGCHSAASLPPSLLPAAQEHGALQSSGSHAGSLRRRRFPSALKSPGKEKRKRLPRRSPAQQEERDQLRGKKQG